MTADTPIRVLAVDDHAGARSRTALCKNPGFTGRIAAVAVALKNELLER